MKIILRYKNIIKLAIFSSGLILLIFPTVVFADNCSGLRDCFNSARSALAASAGLGIFLVLLSTGLDFIPIVGDIKGAIEGLIGENIFTGEKLAGWERGLGAIPFLGRFAKLGKIAKAADRIADLAKAADRVDDLADAAKAVDKIDDIGDAVKAADRIDDAADAVKIADRVDDVGDAVKAVDKVDEAADAVKAVDKVDDAGDAVKAADKIDDIPDPPGTFRDKQGRLRNKEGGRYVKDPKAKGKTSAAPKYNRSMAERRKALNRDALDPNADLSDEARDFIKKNDGKNVPEGYEVSHEEPLYTRRTPEGKKEIDVADNMKTQPKDVHRARHKICGDQYHEFGAANKPKIIKD